MKDSCKANELLGNKHKPSMQDLHARLPAEFLRSDKLIENGLLPKQDVLDIDKATNHLGESAGEIDYLFRRFLSGDVSRRGLRLQFGGHPFEFSDKNWLTVDLDTVEHRAREAGRVSLELEDECFDRVFCTGLDRISRPASLIAEARRVLKRRGLIWVQTPLSKGHKREDRDDQQAYWLFTPKGFRILFERFDEIMCSVCQNPGDVKEQDSFFYGLKPEIAPEATDDRGLLARSMLTL